jgi:3-isopropylmalate/(R)-2-methylmalate dehydratase small subunit
MNPFTIQGTSMVVDRDDIDTDMIIPSRYLNMADPALLAPHVMESIDPQMAEKISSHQHTILVVGQNFGCGSSREHAVWCLTGLGIQAVIAESFARIFFRNCINYGLLPAICPGACKKIREGDEIGIVTEPWMVKNISRNTFLSSKPLPDFTQRIVEAGGLLNYVQEEMNP